MSAFARQQAEYRLRQMRAHQLREDPPKPVVRPRKRVALREPLVWIREPILGGGFSLWSVANKRQELYEAALGG